MVRLRLSKKWILAAIGLLLALLILKIVLILTAKPKVTVDYVAEYNRTACPQNYDPNDNAAPYYQKAFDAFVDMPDEFRYRYINWPTDFNSTEQALLEERLASNSQAFGWFRIAANKPYYWLERKAKKDNYIGSITSPDLFQLGKLAETLGWDSKLKAAKGKFQTAFENILGCYRAGNHKCRSNMFLADQHTGLSIKKTAIKNALVILDRSEVDNKALKFFQENLKQELDRDTYIPGCQAEKLWQYDKLQRAFIDNGKGTGRLWWRIGFDGVIPLAGEGKIYERKIKMSCFTGPTRRQAAEQIEQTSALFNHVMTKTPWQIKDEGSDYFSEIENINKRHISLEMLGIGIDSKNIFHSYQKTRAQTRALITVLALLQFRLDSGQFPKALNDLLSNGYIQSVPQDPYSNEPLVYKFTDDNFKLYSFGVNFKDDAGEVNLDIIYWPVQHRSEELNLTHSRSLQYLMKWHRKHIRGYRKRKQQEEESQKEREK